MLVDSHCHLDRINLDPYDGDLAAAVDAAGQRGVDRLLCIGIDMGNAPDVIAIAERFNNIYASVGVHPLDISDDLCPEDTLLKLADHPKVVAIGETGLDYYYSSDNKAAQQQSFARHLRVSAQCGKPIVVHTRNAREDTLALIQEHGNPNVAGVLHCFTESWEMAEAAIEMGYYISFSGIITFKNAEELREVVRRVPMERLLVETDSPYLAPVPYRGKKNEPKYVVEVAECVAELKGLSFADVASQTSRNFDQLFHLGA
ncbi:hydrolase, TatD family [Spongiibacter sp. IMCC21906]|jgi:TatD DNase family protein|uniref:TatD family hydrolase n=1 Tax=Spongiibacter sp. IMCC21906 TaxID=1620392 RepID=UPI00062E0A10|nr:TatD family hydrolase [Spongiibacter sp. IMCC21906]AKH69816.1 hydrolase, TatD family [Spongiibacter sp. IMCC21906]